MKKSSFSLVSIACLVMLCGQIFGGAYKVDPSHSDIGFSIRHMFTNVKGQFKTFDGSFSFDESNKTLQDISFTVKAASVDTNNSKRDEHLNSPDFFDTAKFSDIQFKSEVVKMTKGHYLITGPLTLHGVTKMVTFKANYLGTAKSPWGLETASFSAQSTILRKDFGMNWNKALDKGGVLVGDEVTLTIEIEAVKK